MAFPGEGPSLSRWASGTGLKRVGGGAWMFWVTYVVGCALLHHLASTHYQDVCRPRWWSLGLEHSTYCSVLHKLLHALRAGPVLAAAPHLRHLHHHPHHLP